MENRTGSPVFSTFKSKMASCSEKRFQQLMSIKKTHFAKIYPNCMSVNKTKKTFIETARVVTSLTIMSYLRITASMTFKIYYMSHDTCAESACTLQSRWIIFPAKDTRKCLNVFVSLIVSPTLSSPPFASQSKIASILAAATQASLRQDCRPYCFPPTIYVRMFYDVTLQASCQWPLRAGSCWHATLQCFTRNLQKHCKVWMNLTKQPNLNTILAEIYKNQY